MASQSAQGRESSPWPRLITLGVLVVALFASLFAGSLGSTSRWSPDLALDLEGGTQIILTPVTTDGSDITDDDVAQAIEIIRQRVDATGVSEAEISSQGGRNIVVGLPGHPSEETLELVRTSAVLHFRPVINYTDQVLADNGLTNLVTGQSTDPDAAGDADEASDPDAAPDPDEATASAGADETGEATEEPSDEADSEPSESADVAEDTEAAHAEIPQDVLDEAFAGADLDGDGTLSDKPASDLDPADLSTVSSDDWITEQILYDAQLVNCTVPNTSVDPDNPDLAMVACDPETGMSYILGPAVLEGSDISSASSGPRVNQQGQPQGGWQVNIDFTSEGGKKFGDVTSMLVDNGYGTIKNQFASVLDGSIISTASVENPIPGGSASISGSFTSEQAESLANQLSFGSLPLTFQVQSEEQISATLGSEQLVNSLIAGAIGLALVVLYLLWQYHGLGVLAVFSIIGVTGLSYFVISLLSWLIGYRLSLAGVVGLIISIGISADSFIVFFERIRDEIRDGRTLRGAVEYGWHRAKQTILVSDAVNFVAAVVLYFLAVGGVRGFAFTLGLTTIIDLVVVMMFTYPVMRLLVRTKFFGGGHRWSGMSAASLGSEPLYRGAGRVRETPKASKKAAKKPKPEVASDAAAEESADSTPTDSAPANARPESMTLAQRRAAERRAQREEN